MTSLSERAAQRCESNILRAVPSHKQAWVWSYGSNEEKDHLQAWIDHNKAYLAQVRASIADGQQTCIDTGWPSYGDFSAPIADDPATDGDVIEKLESIQGTLEKAKEVATPIPNEHGYSFNVQFLQEHFDAEKDADLTATDTRLFDEYSRLELTRPHKGMDDAWHRRLQSNFFQFMG